LARGESITAHWLLGWPTMGGTENAGPENVPHFQVLHFQSTQIFHVHPQAE